MSTSMQIYTTVGKTPIFLHATEWTFQRKGFLRRNIDIWPPGEMWESCGSLFSHGLSESAGIQSHGCIASVAHEWLEILLNVRLAETLVRPPLI